MTMTSSFLRVFGYTSSSCACCARTIGFGKKSVATSGDVVHAACAGEWESRLWGASAVRATHALKVMLLYKMGRPVDDEALAEAQRVAGAFAERCRAERIAERRMDDLWATAPRGEA